jgi:hypothetical protein
VRADAVPDVAASHYNVEYVAGQRLRVSQLAQPGSVFIFLFLKMVILFEISCFVNTD